MRVFVSCGYFLVGREEGDPPTKKWLKPVGIFPEKHMTVQWLSIILMDVRILLFLLYDERKVAIVVTSTII